MRPRRRSWALLVLGPPLCGLVVAGLTVAGWLALGRPEMAKAETWFTIQQTGEAHYAGSPTAPVFFLVIGSDAREGGPAGSRADSLHLIGVNPALGAATILGFPRDTEVPIPGHGSDKINAALVFGGLQLQADTISQLTGVPIPYTVATTFGGLVTMVDEMGGIDIDIPQDQNDPDSGAVFTAGPQHINGTQALAFARNRKSFSAGDIARSENQGRVMLAALSTIRSRAAEVAQRGAESAETMRHLAILGRHVELQGVNLVELYRFGRLGLTLDPARIRNVVIPTGGGAGSNLSLGPGAPALFADFADDAVLQNH